MLFNSLNYLIFLPIVVVVYYCIPVKIRYIWLLAASYFFYMNWNAGYALLLLFSTAVTYVCGLIIQNITDKGKDNNNYRKKLVLVMGLLLNLLLLFFFKYYNFFIDNINALMGNNVGQLDILLPVGISFYIFQALGYLIDVYRSDIKAEKNFLKYALFVSFFPQLVAGPIERSGNLLPQIQNDNRFDFDKFRDGIFLILWGYFMKLVIADRIAIFVDVVYGDIEKYGGCYLVVATVLFAFQIYCDFGGYSYIAMGTAKLLGFKLMDNFNAPYLSANVTEFWRKWHVSLSSWFKDYVYIPLGGNKKGKAKKYRNIIIVFLLSGLWHGASWTYVIWGGLNGIYQIMEDFLKIKRKSNIIRWIITFILVDITWIFFRAEDIKQSFDILASICTFDNINVLYSSALFDAGLDKPNFAILVMALLILLAADFCKYKGICVRSFIQRQNYVIRTAVITVAVLAVFVFGIWGTGYDASGFIYFQF